MTVGCLRLTQGQVSFGAEQVALELWLGTWSFEDQVGDSETVLMG